MSKDCLPLLGWNLSRKNNDFCATHPPTPSNQNKTEGILQQGHRVLQFFHLYVRSPPPSASVWGRKEEGGRRPLRANLGFLPPPPPPLPHPAGVDVQPLFALWPCGSAFSQGHLVWLVSRNQVGRNTHVESPSIRGLINVPGPQMTMGRLLLLFFVVFFNGHPMFSRPFDQPHCKQIHLKVMSMERGPAKSCVLVWLRDGLTAFFGPV